MQPGSFHFIHGSDIAQIITQLMTSDDSRLSWDLDNFDFKATYAVTGATVYFNIPGSRNVMSTVLTSGNLSNAKQFMDQLVPGSTVTFDNITVVGPDGVKRTIQNPPGFSLF